MTLRLRIAAIVVATASLAAQSGFSLSTDKTADSGTSYPTLVQNDPKSGGLLLRQARTASEPSSVETTAPVAPPEPSAEPTGPMNRPATLSPAAAVASTPVASPVPQASVSDDTARTQQQLDNRMATIERLLEQSLQQDRSMMMMMITVTLIVSGVTGLTCIGAVVAVVILQARWINRVSESALAQSRQPGPPSALNWGTHGLPEAAATSPSIQASRQQFSEAVQNLKAQVAAMEASGGRRADNSVRNGQPVTPVEATDASPLDDDYDVIKLLEKGTQLLDIGRADRALVCFDQARVLAPERTEVHLKRARALEQLQRDAEALEAFDQILEIDPSMVAANLGKAGILNRLERYNEALECYETALGHASVPRRPIV